MLSNEPSTCKQTTDRGNKKFNARKMRKLIETPRKSQEFTSILIQAKSPPELPEVFKRDELQRVDRNASDSQNGFEKLLVHVPMAHQEKVVPVEG